MSQICLYLRSKDADYFYNDLSSCCHFSIKPLLLPKEKLFKVSVKSFVCPFSWTVINERYNKLYVNEMNNDLTQKENIIITFTDGNYSIKELCVLIKTELNGQTKHNITYDCIYNKNENKIIITATQINKIIELDFTQSNTIAEILGFKNNLYQFTTTITSPIMCNLYIDDVIYLRSNLSSGFSYDSRNGGASDILQKIEVRSESYQYIYLENEITPTLYDGNINFLDLYITDEEGRYINLNGCEWQCTIVVEIIDKSQQSNNNKSDVYGKLIRTLLEEYNNIDDEEN